MLNAAPKAASSRVWVPPDRTGAVGCDLSAGLGIGPHLHGRAGRAGHRAADQHQVARGHDLDDLQTALGDPLAAHATRSADALLHAGRPRRGADRARRADVVGAVALGARGEVVTLDRAGEALALRGAGDL